MKYKCDCKNIGSFYACDFCVQMRYLIKFHSYKFCVEKILHALTNSLVPLDNYLEHETAKSESFFYFKDNKVCGSLDNPLLDDMNSVKNLGNQLFFSIYLDGKSTYKV